MKLGALVFWKTKYVDSIQTFLHVFKVKNDAKHQKTISETDERLAKQANDADDIFP